jgi:hypothetical protein
MGLYERVVAKVEAELTVSGLLLLSQCCFYGQAVIQSKLVPDTL